MMGRDRYGLLDALFSAKCFAAAMLAYYLALRIGLPRPAWAVVTAYIVSQPLAGAVLSKAFFRVIGTVLGAAMAVILVPNLVNAPELLSLALAGWLGLCIYVALLDRTPRSYVFLLAGYTASIIGFPSVTTPADIFITAILRVQEITLGILCASLVHGVLFPRTVTARLIGRVDAILGDAARWSADALGDEPGEALERDRLRLAHDIFDLHQLSVHLPFDTARLLPRIAVVRALQDQISLIVPLAAACLDRVRQIRLAGPLPADTRTLLDDTMAWMRDGAPADECADTLAARAARLETAAVPGWTAALAANLARRLRELVEAHAACTELRTRLAIPHATGASARTEAVLRHAGRRPLHSDHGRALRSAAAVFLAVTLLCTVWIATAWPDGANAALIAGAVGAVLASTDATPAAARKLLLGALLATLLCMAYDFAILPRVTDYVTLVAVLAPAFLLMGGMMSWPATAPYATGVMLTLPVAVGLTDRFAPGGFDAFVNGNMALLFGMAVPVVSLSIFAPVRASGRARRLLAATRRNLARRCLDRGRPRTERWLATMLDRVAYLYPLVARGEASPDALDEILRDSRVGINIDELRLLRFEGDRASGAGEVDAILHGIRDHLRGTPTPEDDALLGELDGALFGRADADRRLLHPLVGLRRSLFSDAPPPARQPEPVA